MQGTIINSVAIILGGLLGWLAGGLFGSRLRETLLAVLGLVVLILGVEMSLQWHDPLMVIIAVVLGAVIGERLGIERWLEGVGENIQRRLGAMVRGNLAQGFVFASLIYCVGPMAVLGALQSGVDGEHQILIAKAAIDGLTAIAFASTLGLGVMFSSLSVLLYQGALTLLSQGLAGFLATMDAAVPQLTATGGILILGIGLKILDIKQIRVANVLPALPIIILLTYFQSVW
ncbi:MAG: DUF554 domain-containing protein [Firmicutes bacterium]|nr:DUF554 domain-containing protein [Bacillota bacterium]